MTTLKRLLAATDLSPPASHAAERAALLCEQLAADLELLHVIGRAPLEKLGALMGRSFAEVERQLVEASHVELEALAAQLNAQYHVSPTLHVASGTILETLNERADAYRSDMLVVGARGHSFLRHALLGATAERMVRTTRQPILVVKQPPQRPYRHVLLPLDFSDASARSLQLAQAIAPDAVLSLLHVFDVPFESKLHMASVDEEIIQRYRIIERQESLQKLHQLAADIGIAPERVTLHAERGDPWLQIIEHEQEHDFDLIVMGKHGVSRLEALLLGSVTSHVLQQSRCDVLVSL